NLSASPYDYMHADGRKTIVKQNVQKYKLPMVYCNTTGSQTEIIFDGGSLVMDAGGNILAELPYFEEALQSVIWNDGAFDGNFVRPAANVADTELIAEEFDPSTNIDKI